jgi:hypothetical protein
MSKSLLKSALILVPLLAVGCGTEDAADAEMMGTAGMSVAPTGGMMDDMMGGVVTPVGGSPAPDAGTDTPDITPVAGGEGPMGATDTPPPPPPPPPGGMSSCVDIINCISTCIEGDEACFNACLASGSAQAQQQVAAVAQCLGSADCAEGDNQCVQTTCGAEIAACTAGGGGNTPPPPPPGSNYSCADILFCASNCPGGDQGCVQGCIGAGTPEAQTAIQSYSMCLSANQCQDQACVEANCQAEYNTCIPPGNAGCNDTLTCISGCQSPDCGFDCQTNANQAARELLNDLGACMEMNACQDPSCPACSSQLMACQAN